MPASNNDNKLNIFSSRTKFYLSIIDDLSKVMSITLCLVYDFLATENIFTLLSNKMRGSED